MTGLLFLPLLVFALGGFTQWMLILLGRHKTPIFNRLAANRRYLPLADGLTWFGVFVIAITLMAAGETTWGFPGFIGGLLILLVADMMERLPRWLLNRIPRWIAPRWYIQFCARTTHEERVQMVTPWRRLPPPLRARLNAQDKTFFLWLDLVLLGIGAAEETVSANPFRYTVRVKKHARALA